MATTPVPNAASTSTTAATAAPTTQGHVDEIASVYRGSQRIAEEIQADTSRSSRQSGRSRSVGRARDDSRYMFQGLEVVDAQSNEPDFTPEQPDYFKSLVASALETRALPFVTPGYYIYGERRVGTPPLYPVAPGQPQVTGQDLSGEHGTALALELAIKLQTTHTMAQIRSEMTKVATAVSTSDADLHWMQDLLSQLNIYSRLRKGLGPYRDMVMRHRHEAGELFPRQSSDQDSLGRRPRRPGSERTDSDGSEGSRDIRQPESFRDLWNILVAPFKEGNRHTADHRRTTSAYGADAGSNSSSALEEGGTAPAENEPGEGDKRRGLAMKVIKFMFAVIVLIVCFVPILLCLGIAWLLDCISGLNSNSRRRDRGPTQESFQRQARRREYRRKKGFKHRLFSALMGGLSLIVPMLIMALDPSLTKSLITTSVCIFLFGVMIAWRTAMQSPEVLTATATYAAVLVVFTGVNN